MSSQAPHDAARWGLHSDKMTSEIDGNRLKYGLRAALAACRLPRRLRSLGYYALGLRGDDLSGRLGWFGGLLFRFRFRSFGRHAITAVPLLQCLGHDVAHLRNRGRFAGPDL